MTNLSRITAKIFGETAAATGDDPEIGQFGSALAGTYVGTSDVATIQNLPAWSNGFIDSVTPSTQFPPLPEMTGFGKVLSYQTAYTMQKGVPEWDANTTYYTGDFAKGVGEGRLYVSKVDNNLNHAVTDGTYWTEFSIIPEDRLHALKSYKDEGELLTDAEGLADVKYYAHSTFDVSKFTVTGTPTITDDGIASGFSDSNYLSTSLYASSNINLNITLPNSLPSGNEGILVFTGSSLKLLLTSTGKLTLWHNTLYNVGQSDAFNAGTKLSIKLDFVSHKFYVTNLATQTTTQYSINSSVSISSGTLNIGRTDTNVYFNGSIDLKQFSITVDGIPVFNGNQTGIDTIKPDDYTVVGTPTIGADGIASGFSSSNYLSTSTIDFPNAKNWEVVSQFNYISHTATLGVYQFLNGGYSNDLYINTSGYIKINVKVGQNDTLAFSSQVASSSHSAIALTSGSDVKVELKFTGTQYIFNVYQNGSLIYADTKSSTASIYPATSNGINIGSTSNDGSFTTGSIDLNSFKVYVNGDLVYQPCLKIPYTQSKTGSKVVDSAYRDRVNDMYSQFGYAPYYTLSDSNYTIPQGELYGMMNKVMESFVPDYANGITQTSTGTTAITYTCPSIGWINYTTTVLGTSNTAYIKVNNVVVNRQDGMSNQVCQELTGGFPVDAGDVIEVIPKYASASSYLYFFPMKGV